MGKPAAYSVFADTREITHEQWLKLRMSGLGGSDAGAIMGVHPYKGAFAVYCDKIGYTESVEDSEAMRQGRDFEEYVARRFTEKTGLRVRREYGMLRSNSNSFMIADLDRRIVGEKAGLECKTSKDIYLKRYKDGEYPIEYYTQCLHYLAVTGFAKWYLAVLLYGTDLLVFEIKREDVQDDIDALIDAERAFWENYVERREAPPPDGLDSTTKVLNELYPVAEDGLTIDSSAEDEHVIGKLLEYKSGKKHFELKINECENKLKASMQNAQTMRSSYATVTWRDTTRSTLDVEALLKAHPEINVEDFKKKTTTRRFTVFNRMGEMVKEG